MKKNILIAIISAMFLFVFLMTFFFYGFLEEKIKFVGAERVDAINISFEIGDRIGLNADRDMLNFGIIMPGSGSRRSINITNTHPYDVKVKMYSEGNITPFIQFEDDMLIRANESREVFVSVNVPLGSEFEGFSGRIKLAFFPAQNTKNIYK